MKIVVAEKMPPAALQIFLDEPLWQVITPGQIHGDLAAQVADADALLVRSAIDVNSELLRHARKLRVIGRAGVGVDNIDLDAATKAGIAVMNTPGANAVAVAEHTIALMLALARHLTRADVTTRAGKWEKKSLQGSELRDKTLGIVGLGKVGFEVARRAKAFQMDVLAHDPFVSSSIVAQLGITLVSLDEVFARADYLSLHVGLTPQTTRMMNQASIARMKPGARIINCARGELIDDAALAAALASGHLGGAGLDVFTEEPPRESPLLGLANVVATPHIAGSTSEAEEQVGLQIAMQIREYLKHGVIQNAVNVPSVSHDEYVEMQPYIILGERLGSFLAQASDGNLMEISLRYAGRLTEWKTELIRNAVIKGILNQMLSEKANLVNAASLAEERGIRVHEHKKDRAPGGNANVLSVRLKTSMEERLAKGSVLHGHLPRLLALDDIDIEVPLERNLLYLRNRDVPGVIGRIGTILGQHQVNIANFSLGRSHRKDSRDVEAIAVVQVDSPVPEAAVRELRTIEAVTAVKAMRL